MIKTKVGTQKPLHLSIVFSMNLKQSTFQYLWSKETHLEQTVNSPRLTRAEAEREELGLCLLHSTKKPKFPSILIVGP